VYLNVVVFGGQIINYQVNWAKT